MNNETFEALKIVVSLSKFEVDARRGQNGYGIKLYEKAIKQVEAWIDETAQKQKRKSCLHDFNDGICRICGDIEVPF